jgi:hypothetical protein
MYRCIFEIRFVMIKFLFCTVFILIKFCDLFLYFISSTWKEGGSVVYNRKKHNRARV